MTNIPFDIFEQAVIKKILETKNQVNRTLQEQYNHAHIQREFSDAGFFSNFQLPDSATRISPENFQYTHLLCDLNGINNFGGFVLYVRNGKLACLEGYSFDGQWPQHIMKYHLYNSEQK